MEVNRKISKTRLVKIFNKDTEFEPDNKETEIIEELLEEIV